MLLKQHSVLHQVLDVRNSELPLASSLPFHLYVLNPRATLRVSERYKLSPVCSVIASIVEATTAIQGWSWAKFRIL